MRMLQVKQYHREIAQPKLKKALERWRAKPNGYGYPVASMFYFMREDSKGYPTTLRKNGYVVFGKGKSIFSKSEREARERARES